MFNATYFSLCLEGIRIDNFIIREMLRGHVLHYISILLQQDYVESNCWKRILKRLRDLIQVDEM